MSNDPNSESPGNLRVPVLPLTTGVVFPSMSVTVAVDTENALAAADAAEAAETSILLLPQIGGRYGQVGTVGTITETGRLGNGTRTLVVEGKYRAGVENILAQRGVGRINEFSKDISGPGPIADTAGWSPDLSFEPKVELLETIDVTDGMETEQRGYLLRQ
jgi:ATP-dependent Lon protease